MLLGYMLKENNLRYSHLNVMKLGNCGPKQEFLNVKLTCIFQLKQTDRQTERQTGRQADRQTGRQADRQTGRHTDRQTDRQTDRLTD